MALNHEAAPAFQRHGDTKRPNSNNNHIKLCVWYECFLCGLRMYFQWIWIIVKSTPFPGTHSSKDQRINNFPFVLVTDTKLKCHCETILLVLTGIAVVFAVTIVIALIDIFITVLVTISVLHLSSTSSLMARVLNWIEFWALSTSVAQQRLNLISQPSLISSWKSM